MPALMRRLAGLVLILALLVSALAAWLLASEAGLQTALRVAQQFVPSLQATGARGRLLGPIHIEHLRWQAADNGWQLAIDELQLDWSPGALLRATPRLAIRKLLASRLTVHLANDDTPASLPEDLRPPLPIQIEQLKLAALYLDEHLLARTIEMRLHSDAAQHRIDRLSFSHDTLAVSLDKALQLASRPPFALRGAILLQGQLEAHPLTLAIAASGTLERIDLKLLADASAQSGTATGHPPAQPLHGQGQLLLTPFAAQPFARAQLHFTQLNPAAWQVDAPQALLALQLELAPQDAAIAGSFRLDNSQPGPLDSQHIPLHSLSGQLHWQAERLHFSELLARLPDSGELTGQADWQTDRQQLQLDLRARQLNAQKILGMLQPSRLNGILQATLARQQQSLHLDLRDAHMQLLADARRDEQQLDIRQLHLQAGRAALQLHGALGLATPRRFSLAGELRQFDPAAFVTLAGWPAIHLNARLQASGQLQPQPRINAQLALHDSQFANQALAGQARLDLAWPIIADAAIDLSAGSNRLRVRGNYGTADSHLQLSLQAPQLAAYGIEGGLHGQAEVRGSPQQATLNLQLHSERLGWPEKFQLAGLALQLQAGRQSDAPLALEFTLDRLDLPERAALLRQLQLHASGNPGAHQLRISGNLADGNHLQLRAHGGWSARQQTWQGELQEARLQGKERSRNFRLLQAAPLQLALQKNSWQLGPLQLAGETLDWQASLHAENTGRQLHATLQATGSRLGQLDGQLQARMQDLWHIAGKEPWQARLRSDISDLSWLAELIGEGWQSAGRLHGELQLGGTPQQPSGSGQIRGEQLALQLPEQGLQLARGELLAELQDNLLRIRRFAFDSPLQPAPRSLLRGSSKAAIEALTSHPGRLEISGEIPLASLAPAPASPRLAAAQQKSWLDVRLERLGAWQRSDQWLLLSGNGRLSWQAGTLGARGQLRADAGYWQLAGAGTPRLSDDVTITRPGDPAATPPFRPRLDVDIQADLGPHFLFNGAGLSSHLAGTLRLSATGRDMPRASGSIHTREGRFTAYGQTLALDRGILRFDGLLDNPGLDIRATRKELSVDAGVQVSGTAQKPLVRLISDPELPETEKLAWLVLGHGSEQMSMSDATTLLAAAGDLLGNDAGNLMQQIRHRFGVDELGIRQGSLDGQRQATSRLTGNGNTPAATDQQIFTVGKRLSSHVLLSYEQVLGKAESIVKLTVSLGRHLALIGRAGSDNALDIFYTLSFGQPARPADDNR